MTVPLGQKSFLEKLRQIVKQLIVPAVPNGKEVVLSDPPDQTAQVLELVVEPRKLFVEIDIVGLVVFGDDGVQFDDKDLDLIDKFKNPFRDDDYPVVFTHGRPPYDAVADNPGQMPQGHTVTGVIGGPFLFRRRDPLGVDVIGQILTDERHIGMGLQGHFAGQVTGDPPHDFANVPVFNVGTAVGAKISDRFCKGSGCRMKPERHGAEHFPVRITDLDIAVDGFGDTDDLNTIIKHLLGQKSGIGVGVVSPDNHQGIQLKHFTGFS